MLNLKRSAANDDNLCPTKCHETLDSLLSLRYDPTPTTQTSVSTTIITAPGSIAAVTIEVVHGPAEIPTTTTADTAKPDESLTLPAVHQLKAFG